MPVAVDQNNVHNTPYTGRFMSQKGSSERAMAPHRDTSIHKERTQLSETRNEAINPEIKRLEGGLLSQSSLNWIDLY